MESDMDSATLAGQLDSVRAALAESRRTRAVVERLLDQLEARLLRVESATERLKMAVDGLAGSPVAGQEETQSSDFTDLLASSFGPVAEACEELEEKLDAQVSPEKLAETLAAGETLKESVEGAGDLLREVVEDLREELEQRMDGFEDQVDNVRDLAGALAEDLPQWAGRRTQEIGDALDSVESQLDEAREHVRELVEEGLQDLATAFLEDADDRIKAAGGDLLGALGALRDQGEEGIGQIRDKLGQITGQLDGIIRLIEPVKPVLDSAAAIL